MAVNTDYVIACIGCTEVVGDSLGPIVGDILIDKGIGTYVYGTTENPITSKNLPEFFTVIRQKHPDSKVIAVDACLGKISEIGSIKVVRGGIAPGKALNADADKFGDIGVLGVVGEIHEDPMTELLTRSGVFVEEMAAKAADTVIKFYNEYLGALSPKTKKVKAEKTGRKAVMKKAAV